MHYFHTHFISMNECVTHSCRISEQYIACVGCALDNAAADNDDDTRTHACTQVTVIIYRVQSYDLDAALVVVAPQFHSTDTHS